MTLRCERGLCRFKNVSNVQESQTRLTVIHTAASGISVSICSSARGGCTCGSFGIGGSFGMGRVSSSVLRML